MPKTFVPAILLPFLLVALFFPAFLIGLFQSTFLSEIPAAVQTEGEIVELKLLIKEGPGRSERWGKLLGNGTQWN